MISLIKHCLCNHILLFTLLGFMLFSCNDKDLPEPKTVPPDSSGSLKISFQHRVNGAPLALNTGKYVNLNGDTFRVNVFKYYISNIKLKKTDGTLVTIPESYYLIDASSVTKSTIIINNVTKGEYEALYLSIGIDSLRNHTGAQTGALDPNNGTIWTWQDGYMFFILQGAYKGKGSSSNAFNGMIFEVGEDQNYKKLTFSNASSNWSNIKINTGKTSQITLSSNLDETFKTPTTIDFVTTHDVTLGTSGKMIADNYADFLRLENVSNP